MRSFEINTGMLDSDSVSIQGGIRALKQAVNDLRSAAASLCGAWEGEAKISYLEGLTRELAYLEETVSELERHTVQAEASGMEYERCESAVADVVSCIRV